MPELLLVGIGNMGRPYAAAARGLGFRVRAVEAEGRVAGLDVHVVDAVTPSRGDLDEQWVEAASVASAAGSPDGVVAFSEAHVLAAALLQDSLELPGPSLHAAVLSRNKALQRGRFAAHGIRQPEFVVTDDLRASEGWAAERFPVVVKPLSAAGSAGVELVRDPAAYREVAVRRAGEHPLLVETAVDGPEYSWEAIVEGGRVWCSNLTAKETTGPPSFVEVAHRTGVDLEPSTAADVDAFARSVLSALQMSSGIVHLEFRLAADGPTLMEVAVRTPGDYLMDLLGLTYGHSWYDLVVRVALGLPLPETPPSRVRYAASYLLVAPPGVVTSVDGLDAVRAHPSVVTAGVQVRVGDTVSRASSSLQRVGHVVLAADTRPELEEALELVRETLVVRTA